jgi:hypothetical protein
VVMLTGFARFTRLAWLARWPLLVLLAVFSRGSLILRLLFARLRGCFGGRLAWSGWGVLSHDGGVCARRRVVGIPAIGGCLWGSIEVRVRLARVCRRAAVRARPTAATMRASTFGHATMFVMGCLRARAPVSAGLPSGAPVSQAVARNGSRAREGHS